MSSAKLANPPFDGISRVRFAPRGGGNTLLVSSWDTHVRLYDVAQGMLMAMHRHSHAVLDCAFLQDPSKAVSGGLSQQVIVRDFPTQSDLRLGAHDGAIRCVEFHAGTQQVLTGSWDRTLRFWDCRHPMATITTLNLGSKVFTMDVSAEHIVAGCADKCLHIYDVRRLTAPLEKRETSLKHQLRAVKVSVDGQSYASASVEGRVAIEYFNPEDNHRSKYAFKCHRTKDSSGEEVVHAVNALAYHPAHGTFATGGSDGGVSVWDGLAKKRLWRSTPFDTSVSSVDFSADGSLLAIGVSYTFDGGDVAPPPPTEICIKRVTDAEMAPKSRQ